MAESLALRYRTHVVARIPLEDDRLHAYPLCTSPLEVALYKQCRVTLRLATAPERAQELPTRVANLRAQIDSMSQPAYDLIDLLLRFQRLYITTISRVAYLRSAELYDENTERLYELVDDFDRLAPGLEDCVLYSLTNALDKDAATVWYNQYHASPAAVAEQRTYELGVIVDEAHQLMIMVEDQIKNPGAYGIDEEEDEL